MSKKRVEYVYSTDGELFNYQEESECIDYLLNNVLTDDEITDMLEEGGFLEFERGERVSYKASDFVDQWLIDDLLENMNIRATDNCGESAEYFAVDVGREVKDKLGKYLKTWANKNLDCYFYGVNNIEKVSVKVTEELVKEYLGEN